MPKISQPLISVITVTRNDLVGFIKTYKSVAPLLKYNIEWIIKDGGSDQIIVSSIKKLLKDKNITFLTNKDNGTYNAMNIGLEKAIGDWVIFMNGGDSFYSKNLFDKIQNHIYKNSLNCKDKNIILGNYKLLYKSNVYIFKKKKKKKNNFINNKSF